MAVLALAGVILALPLLFIRGRENGRLGRDVRRGFGDSIWQIVECAAVGLVDKRANAQRRSREDRQLEDFDIDHRFAPASKPRM